MPPTEPLHDCPLCPRLAAFRTDNRRLYPDWFNGPVPSWGDDRPRLIIVGLAPGLRGANRTGRPFTGDHAGMLLYATLKKFGLATGEFLADPNDSLQLVGTRIVNAVRCVPPQNKPVGAEINACRQFLGGRIDSFPNLAAIVTLGRIAHESTVRALGARPSAAPFGHNAHHMVGGIAVFSSYHCSRYNTNTGRLTEAMFRDVFENAAGYLKT